MLKWAQLLKRVWWPSYFRVCVFVWLISVCYSRVRHRWGFGGLSGWRSGINQAFDLNSPSRAWGRDNGGDWSSPTDIATAANYLLIGAILWLCLLTALSPTQSLTMSPLVKTTGTLAFTSLYAHTYMGYTMHMCCCV